MDNLRWGKRFPTDLKARFGVESCSAGGSIDDLSVFGFFLRSSRSYPPSTLLKIEICVEEGRIITLVGSVQWNQERKKFLFWVTKEAGMGIKIEHFLSGQEEYDNLCQQLCRTAA
ncbi:MAG: hypothetical protein JXK94_01450 [Deltaproteobacteria bacterium]|nr:hypothetical protein [Deltaproteobacteria bacterium]